MAHGQKNNMSLLPDTHHFLQMGEGDGGAVKEVGLEPPLLIATMADSSTCKVK